ncbi:MAG: HMA2 domain-containing protein, partial [Planctomycetota bacterium]
MQSVAPMVVRLDLRGAPIRELQVRAETPGRLRLDVPGLRWNEPFARRLEEELHGRPGVLDVTPTLTTGRLLVHFDPRRADAEALREVVLGLVPKEPSARRARSRTPWHSLPVEEVLRRVVERRKTVRPGTNRVIGIRARTSGEVLLEQVENRPALLLLGAGALSFLIGDRLEAVALSLAVGANVAIGFV